MTPFSTSDVLPGLVALAVVFILGTWWGLWLAWTQRARMERFAVYATAEQWADRAQKRLNDEDYKMRGVN